MSLINISNLTFSYDGSYENIFDKVSFKIDTNWKLGLCGRNGKGKTTFLNLLMGKFEYSGNITSSVNFEYFPFRIDNPSQLTIDIINEINPYFQEWQLQIEFSKLLISPDILYRPFETLSNGEQTKTLLAVLFLKENSFLLIDEPTNHLDMDGRRLVSEYLNSKSGFILVSHDRIFLDSCVDHIMSINRANIEISQGNFSSWLNNKQLQDDFELKQNSKLKKDIKRLSETARQKAQWSDKIESSKIGSHSFDRGYIGHTAAAMMKRSKSIEKRLQSSVNEKEKLLKNIEKQDKLKISPLVFPKNTLIECKNISLSYGDKEICHNVTFSVNRGDRVALYGKNGSGKTSLIKLICGENIKFSGEFSKANGVKISYVFQNSSNLSGLLSDFESKNGLDVSLFRAILRKLDLPRSQFDKNIKDYSAGQKKKVLIAKSLCTKAHLYIWDEPLNYIDVLSRIQIEDLLKENNCTLIFVEHDKAFCDNIATKFVYL